MAEHFERAMPIRKHNMGDARVQEETTVEIQSKQLSRLQPCKCYETKHDLAQNNFMVHSYWLDWSLS